MAPTSRDGATTDPSIALRRKRSVAELKRDVLSLVRRTRSALPSDSSDGTRLSTHYQRFRGACSMWVSTIFGSCADASTSRPSQQKEVRAKQQQQQTGQSVWEQLAALTQFATHQQRDCGDSRELASVVVRSIGATTQIWKRRRKRKLPTAAAVTSAAGAGDGGDATTSGDLCRVAEFIGVWLLHSSGLLRLEDVILEVVSSGAAQTWEWLTAPVHFLVSRRAQHLHLGSPTANADANTVAATLTTTTHRVVESVLRYIIRLAFTDESTSRHSRSGSYSTHTSEQAAMQVLEELCFFTCAGFSIPTLRLVTKMLSKRAMLDGDYPENARGERSGNMINNFGCPMVARDHVVGFLQPQIAKLVSPYSLVQAAYTHDELEEMFAAYQACLPTPTFVQIIRQFIYEASDRSSGSDDISSDAAVSGEPKSVVCDALHQLILSLASKRSGFVDQVLTLAHELASEGVQGMSGFLLRHSLELVAAVSSGANRKNTASLSESTAIAANSNSAVDIYRDWVCEHLAAAQDASAGSKTVNTDGSDAAPALRLRCLKQRKTCSLVTSKRQIQFLCAFLLEFDRREQQSNRRNGAAGSVPSQYPVAKSDHVAAHLSVMKTHQPQFPSGGLIMDFCSQTRSRYLELLKIEQATTAAANSGEAATQNVQSNGKKWCVSSSPHSAKVRGMVRETIQLYRDTKKLSPQLRQWKMFQPQLWKQELIPCCLDVDFDNLQGAGLSQDGGASGDRCAAESRLLEHVAFVHALAKSGLVSVREYSQFLTCAEEWLEGRRKRKRLKKTSHKRQWHEAGVEGFGSALERLQLEMNGERSDKVRKRRDCASQETMSMLREALESTLEPLCEAAGIRGDTIVPTKQMQSFWEDGCVRVLELLGLDQIDTFFAYLVPVLGRSTSPSQKDVTGATSSTASQVQDRDGTMTEMSIANFFMSQVSWTEQRVDERFMHEVSCLAAVVASLLGKNGESQPPAIRPDLALLIQRIDEECAAGDDASASTKLLARDRLLRRSLFYSTMLRAAAALSSDNDQVQARIVTSLLQCESLDSGIRDFVSWIGYRSIVAVDASQLSGARDRQVASPPALGEKTRVQPLRFLSGNLCAVSDTRWYKEAFNLDRIAKDRLQKTITLELRYGLELFGGASASTPRSLLLHSPATTSGDGGGSREWLPVMLDAIADLGGFRVASVEDVIEWIIAEILFQITTRSCRDDILEETSPDNSVALMLLVLNDLMHKLSSRDVASTKSNDDFAVENRELSSGNHDRVLAFYVASVIKVIRENGRAFPVNRNLHHHGFEVLEICARHHIDCRFSKELISTGGGDGLLDLFREIGDHFESQFPWPLLQALFFYLIQLVCSDQGSYAPILDVRDLPAAIVVRCAMEYPRLRTVVERRCRGKNGSEIGKQVVFMKHLRWIHQFCHQVVQEEDDLIISRDREPDDREAPSVAKSEMFPSEVEEVKFQILILKYLFRWKCVQVPDLVTQSRLVSPFYRDAAVRTLRAFGVDPRKDGRVHSKHMLPELATSFVHEWLQTAFAKEVASPAGLERQVDFHFQLFLVHAVAELCKRSAQVSKTLLQSWRKSPSVAIDGSALFIVLLVISLSSDDDINIDRFDQVLGLNSSMWLNEFPMIALHVHSMSLLSSKPGGEESSSVVKLTKVVANAQSFASRLELVMSKVLKHGVANQVDVLDAKLPLRIRQVWPNMSNIVSQLHVLSLDDDPSEI